ncbi:ABC transporter ATP-binding protein [Spirillospora sp. NPDC048819]|uniref:ABC transporter ATP-binding protein n=1 Tax=Spirillospora sp. NPDC048819 TaxID=3155268 RepID=UPI0033DA37C9
MTQVTDATARSTASPQNAEHAHIGLTFEHVSHWFVSEKDAKLVLEDLTFQVPDQQFVAIVGGSGCGKTTALNMVAGLIKPTEGRVEARIGEEVISLPSHRLGYMWARDTLLPWRTLQRNVEFGLEVRGMSKAERRARAGHYLEMVGLAGSERKFPQQLSHGMRQRGSLARLLATEPSFLLMDEPFSALDAQTKGVMQQEFLTIWEEERRTVVYVTHDLTEAALLADRVLVMGQGYLAFDIEIPFERPRKLDELRFSTEFAEMNRYLYDRLLDAQSGGRA